MIAKLGESCLLYPSIHIISQIKLSPSYLASFCPACGEIGGQSGAHKLEGECGQLSSKRGAWTRLSLGKKQQFASREFQGLQLVEAAWLEQRVHWWGGVRLAIQEHPLPVGTEGWLERPVVQSWGGAGEALDSAYKVGWAEGPGRKEILYLQTRTEHSPLEQ